MPDQMKRILALDGGGIRGVFSLQVLARIEGLLREHHGRPGLVLADVFHLIAGTSTGAIIAALLSWGLTVAEAEALYIRHGPQIFARAPWLMRWKTKYRAEAMARFFRETFHDQDTGAPALLGSRRLRTMLLVVMRNASTGSPWPVTNNPAAVFNDRSLPDCNLDIPLWQLLRGSTAAPTFFPPEEIVLSNRRHLFVDGGITPFNNPALLAALVATLPCYRVGWPAGRERLHLVSVGTGSLRSRLPERKLARQVNVFDQISFLIPALIGSSMVTQDALCRVLGDCVHGAPIDAELGALDCPSLLGAAEQKFTYARYDLALDAQTPTGKRLSRADTQLDNLRAIPVLQELGRGYAREHVRVEHLFPRAAPAAIATV